MRFRFPTDPLFWRLALSLLSGLIVLALCFHFAVDGTTTQFSRWSQERTQHTLDDFEKALAAYRHEHGKPPASLKQITDLKDYFSDQGSTEGVANAEELAVDGWGQPLIYRTTSKRYLLISKGEDGKLGGTGFDCDLTSANPYPPQAQISWPNNLRHPASQKMLASALCGAILVSSITFAGLTNKSFERSRWLKTTLDLFVVLVAALFISMLIVVVGIPSHH